MKKVKLIIREKGRYVELPGVPPFRSPAKVDVTKIKLSLLVQALHSCGVSNYELISSDHKEETNLEEDFKFPEKNENNNRLSKKLDGVTDLLVKLISKGSGKKVNNSEQITNRLNRIESMLKQGVKNIHVSNEDPVLEEPNDQYIPEIDVSEMQIKGKTSDVVDQRNEKEIDAAVDLLSSLTRHGGL